MKNKIIIFLLMFGFNGFGQGTIIRTLPSVDNTPDIEKPVSIAQRAAIDQKKHVVSSIAELQAFTGTIADFDGTWKKKNGNVQSNGGAFAGTLIRVSSTVYWERETKYITTDMFGAKGDNIADDTTPLQNFINYKLSIGGDIYINNGEYKVTNTLNIGDTQGITIKGNSSQGCQINFVNTVVGKPLFSFSASSSYCNVEDMIMIDVNAGTSTAIKVQDQLNIGDPRPNWKMSFSRIRVANFLVGYLATTDTPLNGANHAFLDGVSFYHCKFRNCRTSYLNQNIQAVNINFFNTDIENDVAGEQYTMIKDESGFTMNIYGGSWIGSGKIYDGYYNPSGTTLFANGHINWDGTRFEIRGGSIGNIVTIPKKQSSIFLNLTFSKCSFGLNNQDLNFCDYTGKVNINISDCLLQSGTLTINQYPTSGLTGTDATGGIASYGSVLITKSSGFKYVRNEGSAYGTFQRNHTAKVKISETIQGTNNQFDIDAQGFMKNVNDELTQRSGGVGYMQSNVMVYNVENPFLGLSALKMKMPYYATPMSLVIFKNPRIFAERNIINLYFVKDNSAWANPASFNVATDGILMATTGDTYAKYGIIEVPFSIGFDYLVAGLDFKSGFGNWLEGRIYIEHTGSASFSGFVGVKYY